MRGWWSTLFLALAAREAAGQSACSVCEFVAAKLLDRMPIAIDDQIDIIYATVCPSVSYSSTADCIDDLYRYWDEVTEAISSRPLAEEGTCDAVRCERWQDVHWSCETCRSLIGEVGQAVRNSTAVSYMLSYLKGEALCEIPGSNSTDAEIASCHRFVGSVVPPALKVLAEAANADGDRICDESFAGVCSSADEVCEPYVASLLRFSAEEEQVAEESRLLTSEVCSMEDLEDVQQNCTQFVTTEWSDVMAAIAADADVFARRTCYGLEVRFVPDEWDCLTCERELKEVAAAFSSPESVDGMVEYLSEYGYCEGQEDQEDCEEYLDLFVRSAVPVLAGALEATAGTYCVDVGGC